MSETMLLREAWAENDRLRAFIRSIEWNGTSITGYDGFSTASCPACGGFKPGAIVEDEGQHERSEWGHQPSCKLIEALSAQRQGKE